MISGTWNFRDLGGIGTREGGTIRSGALFRSASLAAVDDEGRRQMAELGITDVFDIREPGEHASDGQDTLPQRIRLHVKPFGADASTNTLREAMQELLRNPRSYMCSVYASFTPLEGTRDAIGSVIRTLVDADAAGQPGVLVHCAAGKDRTGWLIAVVLQALGVDDDDIDRDYLLSNSAAGELARRFAGPLGISSEAPVELDLYGVRAEYLASARDAVIEQFGTFEQYLAACGVTEQDAENLRQSLLR